MACVFEGEPETSSGTGHVKIWHHDKGFGFIVPDSGGADLFAHKSSLVRVKLMAEGNCVGFTRGLNRGRVAAVRVWLLKEDGGKDGSAEDAIASSADRYDEASSDYHDDVGSWSGEEKEPGQDCEASEKVGTGLSFPDSYHREMVRIYREVNPTKVKEIPSLLQKYAEREEQLLRALYVKYKPSRSFVLKRFSVEGIMRRLEELAASVGASIDWERRTSSQQFTSLLLLRIKAGYAVQEGAIADTVEAMRSLVHQRYDPKVGVTEEHEQRALDKLCLRAASAGRALGIEGEP
eukprot:g53882.t1